MTEPSFPESGDQTMPRGVDDLSPLQNMLAEMHELHVELLNTGFDRRSASQIVAAIISDTLAYRQGYDNDSDDSFEDDEELFDDSEDDD